MRLQVEDCGTAPESENEGSQEKENMSFYEVLGIGYVITGTAAFTVQVLYFAAKGVAYIQRLIQRAQAEESIDLQRSLSIKRELAETEARD
jgi:hypothetical protein